MAEVASISQQAVSRITKGAGTGECTCRLSFGCQSDNLLTTGWHAGLFCVYLTAGKKRFLRFSEACDYYNLGLVHIRRLAREADAIYRIYGAPQLIEREKLDQYMQELRQS